MGFLTNPKVTQVDPTPGVVKGPQNEIADFIMQMFQNPGANPFASATSDLQRQGTDAISAFLNQPAPEQQVFDNISGGLTDLANNGVADQITQAGLPLFQQALQRQLGGASNAAPGRFGSAFAQQGIDLASRANQDFNLFQQQALQQDVQNRLGAAGMLGTLAGQAGNNPFQRMIEAGRFGLDQSNSAMNPMLQLMLAGMGWTQPMQQDTVVGKSPLDYITDIGGAALMIPSLLRGGGSGGGSSGSGRSGGSGGGF